jgi:hypothetical protein
MTSPKLCAAGVTLRDQVNRAFPDRDRRSDGWIGDSSHAARKSDHNPTAEGWVRAIDIDADISDDRKASYVFADQLRLLARRDKRLAYIIYSGRIASRRSLWRWKPYKGVNPHVHHIHCSFSKKGDTDGREFQIPILQG